jgi:undecaprenyl-diphosphatase
VSSEPTPLAPPRFESGRWALVRGARATWRIAASAWRAAPPAAPRRWAAALGLGLLACGALAWFLSVTGQRWAAAGGQVRDEASLRQLVADDHMSFQAAIWFEGVGSSAMLLPLVALVVVLAARAARPLLALTMFFGYLLLKLVVWIGWQTWDRPRPDFVADGIAAPPLHAYPSGHAAQVVVVWGLVMWLWARRSGSVVERTAIAALLVTVLAVVTYARLRLGTHWPSDIVAGAVLGFGWLLSCIVALRRGEAAGGR